MDQRAARKAIESFRIGIPPLDLIKEFTVGLDREKEILENWLHDNQTHTALIHANYGVGKTHLLRYIHHEALSMHYMVSFVTVDSSSEVRFNRMDQVLGSICKNLQIDTAENSGFELFFQLFQVEYNKRKDEDFFLKISGQHKWYKSMLTGLPRSVLMYYLLRAWILGDEEVHSFILNYLYESWNYSLGDDLLIRRYLIDKINHKQQYLNKFTTDSRIYRIRNNAYEECWHFLHDIDAIAKHLGYRGFVILFDEYEDVITNLNNIQYQEKAFENLFHFFRGERFLGKSFYAVTPDFVNKSRNRLRSKERYEFDDSIFDKIEYLEPVYLTEAHLQQLLILIMEAHGDAFGWDPLGDILQKELDFFIDQHGGINGGIRSSIKKLIGLLDKKFEDAYDR